MRTLIALIPLFAATLGAVELADGLTLSGWGKQYLGVTGMQDNVTPPDVAAYEPQGTVQQTLRLRLFYKPIDWFSAETAWQVSPTVSQMGGNALTGLFAPSLNDYRITDLLDTLYTSPAGQVAFPHSLDRLTVTFSLPFMDIYAGRQAISFGAAKFINPTDVFAPLSFQDINREEKVGVDAVRVKFPLGEMNELDAGYVFGPDGRFSKSAAFVRAKFALWETDISLMLVEYQYNLLSGLSIERAIGGAGVWLEAAYTADTIFKESERMSPGIHGDINGNDDFRLSVGADYNFAEANLVLFGEYHFSLVGTLRPSQYLENIWPGTGEKAYSDSGVYLLGQHYLAVGFTWEIVPLLNGSLQTLINLTDGSLLLSPRLEYSVADDLFWDVGASIGAGVTARQGDFMGFIYPVPRSEFGLYPYTVYTTMRLYF
ncbi:MAG TPA: hypothetical protein PLV42_05820 [bacterium]|nr:hypothetical protein [bacterium]